jgi:hypothetical protein
MAKPIDPRQIKKGDRLTEKESDALVTVIDTSEEDIAWFQQLPEGGVFGECRRSMANEIFKNVAPCQAGN